MYIVSGVVVAGYDGFVVGDLVEVSRLDKMDFCLGLGEMYEEISEGRCSLLSWGCVESLDDTGLGGGQNL